jgi:phosphate transport system substrate-binding protein
MKKLKPDKKKGIEVVEPPIALDGIAVIANRKNNFAAINLHYEFIG